MTTMKITDVLLFSGFTKPRRLESDKVIHRTHPMGCVLYEAGDKWCVGVLIRYPAEEMLVQELMFSRLTDALSAYRQIEYTLFPSNHPPLVTAELFKGELIT